MSDQLISDNGRFRLIQQSDGNVVTYGPNGYVHALGKVYEPPPPPPVLPGDAARPTQEDVRTYRGNFCNLTDSFGRAMFDPFISSLTVTERADWFSVHRANGSTHIVLAPDVQYPAYTDRTGIQPHSMLAQPATFRAAVVEALNTPSASGRGFVPVIFLDEGGRDPRQRIDTFWRPLLDAIKDLLPYCIVVPGWELVTASFWSSADLSYAMKWLGAYGVPHLWVHLSKGRGAGSSNPLEADDPWQGGERMFWFQHGGEFVEGFLFQSWEVEDGGVLCDINADDCWSNRWMDVVPRVGRGMNGWRVMPLVLFEGPAYWFTRGRCSSVTARDWATEAKRLAEADGVTVGFGNGLPW